MYKLNKAIKDIDESLFNRLRAKYGGEGRNMESAIVKVLNDLAKPKRR